MSSAQQTLRAELGRRRVLGSRRSFRKVTGVRKEEAKEGGEGVRKERRRRD